MKTHFMAPAVMVFALGACQTASSPSGEADLSVYESALLADYRTDEDRAKDDVRLPVETLAFMDIEPSDTVVELEAGGGYFTALLAASVGPEGRVWMQNPAVFDQFWGGGNPPRLETFPGQVIYLRSDFDNLSVVETGSVDVVTWVQGPHELWYLPEGATEPLGDPAKTFSEIARVLKNGGSLYVQDHRAPAGAPTETGGQTHRIDPDHIDTLAVSTGLTLTDTSDLFANPNDDLTVNVFDESVRGQTDQFLARYQKQWAEH